MQSRSPYSRSTGGSTTSAPKSRAPEGRIDVLDAHAHEMAGRPRSRRAPLFSVVGDHDGAVAADAHLGPVGLTDAHPLGEAEGAGEERDRGAHVGVDEDRNDGRRQNGAVVAHVCILSKSAGAGKGAQRRDGRSLSAG